MSTCGVNNSKTHTPINRRSISHAKKKRKKRGSFPNTDLDLNSKSRHYVSSIDKQILFQDIITQFMEWPAWQKRLLLCRVTERTSLSLLSTLATVLEPIFHRDFEVKSKHGFHSSLIKTFTQLSAKSGAPLTPIAEPLNNHSSPSTLSVMVNQTGDTEALSSLLDVSKGPDRPPSHCSTVSNPLSSFSPTPSLLSVASIEKKKVKGRRGSFRRGSLKNEESIVDVLNSKMLLGRGTLHDHAIDRNSSSLSTMEFLLHSHKRNVGKLGVLVKPSSHMESLACVKQYKHHKWWLPPINNGPSTLKKVSKRGLLKSFKKITDEFLSRYVSWNNAEKGDFLLHVVDYCQPEEIKFFANCIYQRVEKIEDINSIDDDVLLNVFRFLRIDDLARVAQVCKRWKQLAWCGEIWEKKCYDLAREHNHLEVIKNLEMSSAELDWKLLYNELNESILFLESVEAHANMSLLPDQVATQNLSDGSCSDNGSESPCLQDGTPETDVKNENDTIKLLEDKISEVNISDTNLCDSASVCSVQDHVRFALEQNESMLKTMMSMNNLPDDYATEKEMSNRLEEPDEEKHDEGRDVAFDVRVRLVQASNQLENKMVTTTESDEDDYQLMQISNIKTVNRVRKLEGHVDAVLCLQFDSKRVVTGSSDRTVRLWDIRSGRCFRCLVGHQGGVRCLKFDDKYIATGSWDTTVMIWDVVSFALICTIIEHTNCVSCIEVTSDFLITASHDTTVCIFEKHTWQLLTRLEEHTAPVSSLCLVSATELLTASHDKMLILWDLDTYCILRKFDGMKYSCLCVKVCGGLVAAGASDGSITFWDLSTSNMEGCIVAHDAPVNALCFVESRFFSAGEYVVKEWDLSTCTCLRSLQGHTGQVLCLRASAKRVVSGSGDGTTRIWDMACKLQQIGRNYDELNKNIIPTRVLNEHQYKEIMQNEYT